MKRLLAIFLLLKNINSKNHYSEVSIYLVNYEIKNSNFILGPSFSNLLTEKNNFDFFNILGVNISWIINLKYLIGGLDININKTYPGLLINFVIPKINIGISYNFIQKTTNIYGLLKLRNKKYISLKVNIDKIQKLFNKSEIIDQKNLGQNATLIEKTDSFENLYKNLDKIKEKNKTDLIIQNLNIQTTKKISCNLNQIELILSDNVSNKKSEKELIDLLIDKNIKINKLILEGRSTYGKVKLYTNFNPELYKLLDNIHEALHNLQKEYKNQINNKEIEDQNNIFLKNFIELINDYSKYENILINMLKNKEKNEFELKILLKILTKITIIYFNKFYPYEDFIKLSNNEKENSKINYEKLNSDIKNNLDIIYCS